MLIKPSFKKPKSAAGNSTDTEVLVLSMDTKGTKFFPPKDGWPKQPLTVIYHTDPAPQTTSE